MNERRDQEITALIKRAYDPVMTEPVPARLVMRPAPWVPMLRAAAVMAIGIGIGLAMAPYVLPTPAAVTVAAPLPVRAARAHAVYVSEVRHPVEVEAKEEKHLVAWLSKRLDTKLRVPVLADEGFNLLGGRLLPGPEGPVAQFMYQDTAGTRLTLYVTRPATADTPTAFRFAQEDKVSVFYWIDGQCGYAISGEIDRPRLTRVANIVYRQLEP
jgi:anti-sigma factor RsiW